MSKPGKNSAPTVGIDWLVSGADAEGPLAERVAWIEQVLAWVSGTDSAWLWAGGVGAASLAAGGRDPALRDSLPLGPPTGS